jgi:hypothetical protein
MSKVTTRRVPTVETDRAKNPPTGIRDSRRPQSTPTIPLDDEPLTPGDRSAIEQGRRAFAQGDYRTLAELKASLAADVARQRLRPRRKGARSRS